MVCSSCGTDNDAARKFCRECGQRLAIACPACSAANSADDKFCGECGTPLAAAPSPAPAGPAGAGGPHEPGHGPTERRLVTVLFADLVGSTPFAEGRDPEDVRSMLAGYFDSASEAVQRHGGVVEKFIGDAVMAVWGTPVAHEDDAERAVRAALEIVDRVEALGDRLRVTLQARVGVLTGEAVAAVGAGDQGLVAGDMVNTASRLQSAAEPGTVLVGERTYRAAAEAVAFAPVEPLTLKGKLEKVPAWRALRVVGEVGGSGRGLAPEPPFVGRDEELRLAKDLLHTTGRERRPRLLSLTGVAGIGKSRLLWELRKYVDGLTEPVYWHQGRCPAYGEGVTFWAFAEMVRGRAGIAETDDDETARERLDTYLEGLVADADERRWMAPRLGHLLGLDPAPPGGRDEMFGAWLRFVERVADQGTTVLAFEDMHWADPGLLDLVESMLAWSRTSPILLVTLARPELAERRATWGAGIRAFSALHLEPLPDEDIRDLVTGYVEGLPEADLQRLVARAEGIPLYAVETVRMLADRGALEQAGTTYRVVGDLGQTLEVPETLHALVAARLDGLPDAERSLVLDAAVTGHSFTLEAVCAVSGRPADEVEPRLRALVGKEVLDVDVDPRSAERGQYRFVQSVIQEVAYATLSKAARRSKHLAVARFYAERDEEELAGIIASHYLDAYRAEPSAPDAEDIAGQARDHLRRAAERALSLGSPEAAVGYATSALDLATTTEDRAALHAIAARGASLSGRGELAWEHTQSACDAYRILGDLEREGLTLARTYLPGVSAAVLAERRARLEDLDNRLAGAGPAKALVMASLADQAEDDGHHREALTWSENALILAEASGDDEVLGWAARVRAGVLFNAGRHFEAGLLAAAVVDLAQESGSAEQLGVATAGLGIVLAVRDPRGGLQAFLEAAEIGERAGIRPMQAMNLANAAESAIGLGDLGVAERTLARSAELAGSGLEDDGADCCRAMLAAYLGDTASAWVTLDRLEAERRSTWTSAQMDTWYLRTRSAVHLVDGDWTEAFDRAREAIAREPSGSNAGNALWQGAQAAARLRDMAALEELLQTTSGLRGDWVDVVRATANAALRALRGDAGAADAVRAALDAWRDRDLPLDHALATGVARHVLAADEVPHDDVEAARAYLRELGAEGLLRLL
ncbi:MAG TPA: adenylate/guanylate cyclase domain-containing protein [Actinomycetes bacterium]|nr:adenylate/guanylate cyclase domain-containing protein [Actinomycetes bacterium]